MRRRLAPHTALALLAPLVLAAPAVAATPVQRCVPLPASKIAIQLYSLNNVFTPGLNVQSPVMPLPPPGAPRPAVARAPRPPADPAVIDSVLGRLHAMGYRNVESAGNLGLSAKQFGDLLDKNHLKIIGSHGSLDPQTWDQMLADAAVLKQGPFIGSGGYGGPGVESLEDTLRTAKNLNALGERARAKGLRLYVHNHTHEFDKKFLYDINKNGKPVMTTAWEIVAAETDPRFVNFEVDVHWALEAYDNNQDALLAFIRKHSDRIVLYHIKDTDGPRIADLGVGVTNWPAVYAAGKNVQYYIFEYDFPPDAMKSAEIAYKYMTCAK